VFGSSQVAAPPYAQEINALVGRFALVATDGVGAAGHGALKAELMQTEMDFCPMAQPKGVPAAFERFAADDAAVLRC
jgi:hypothetical protein